MPGRPSSRKRELPGWGSPWSHRSGPTDVQVHRQSAAPQRSRIGSDASTARASSRPSTHSVVGTPAGRPPGPPPARRCPGRRPSAALEGQRLVQRAEDLPDPGGQAHHVTLGSREALGGLTGDALQGGVAALRDDGARGPPGDAGGQPAEAGEPGEATGHGPRTPRAALGPTADVHPPAAAGPGRARPDNGAVRRPPRLGRASSRGDSGPGGRGGGVGPTRQRAAHVWAARRRDRARGALRRGRPGRRSAGGAGGVPAGTGRGRVRPRGAAARGGAPGRGAGHRRGGRPARDPRPGAARARAPPHEPRAVRRGRGGDASGVRRRARLRRSAGPGVELPAAGAARPRARAPGRGGAGARGGRAALPAGGPPVRRVPDVPDAGVARAGPEGRRQRPGPRSTRRCRPCRTSDRRTSPG